MSDRHKAAEGLAQIHYQSASTSAVYEVCRRLGAEDQPEEPIKLLEVNEDTSPTGIVPLRFGPLPERGITYACTIIEVTPEEYQQIENGELSLPQGWEHRRLISRLAETVNTDE